MDENDRVRLDGYLAGHEFRCRELVYDALMQIDRHRQDTYFPRPFTVDRAVPEQRKQLSPYPDSHPCSKCPNALHNGGSGICHCTAPLFWEQQTRPPEMWKIAYGVHTPWKI